MKGNALRFIGRGWSFYILLCQTVNAGKQGTMGSLTVQSDVCLWHGGFSPTIDSLHGSSSGVASASRWARRECPLSLITTRLPQESRLMSLIYPYTLPKDSCSGKGGSLTVIGGHLLRQDSCWVFRSTKRRTYMS